MSGTGCDCIDPVFGRINTCELCKPRTPTPPRAPRPACPKCQAEIWGSGRYHRSCCPQPTIERPDWAELEITEARNGLRLYFLPCEVCHGRHGIKNALVPVAIRDAGRLTADYRDTTHPCARCGSSLTEYHHWAPQAIFADADSWPGSYLCRPCHTLWHQSMRDSGAYRLDQRRHCDWAPEDSATWRWQGGGAA